ncbi:Pentatricopeptide repeat-containing protein [Forsythia ovata]|uniref:Pentatricopeptide repeat-containing protein n=1 Tax=Forsythia ovata TaxID=205694 RepID=A0ABD1SLY8_9LAMI
MRVLDQIHAHIFTHLHLPPSNLSFTLSKILCFVAYRNVPYTKRLLSQIPNPTIFSYNTLIRGLLSKNPCQEPIFLFKKLLHEKFLKSNTLTLAFLLKSCSILAALKEGQQIHRHVIASGFGSNLFVHTSLLNFYMICEEVALGRIVFNEITEKNVVA